MGTRRWVGAALYEFKNVKSKSMIALPGLRRTSHNSAYD